MFHLTLTGYYAGTPICGVDRREATERGDKFVHAIYRGTHSQQGCAPVCLECLKVWREVEEADDLDDYPLDGGNHGNRIRKER